MKFFDILYSYGLVKFFSSFPRINIKTESIQCIFPIIASIMISHLKNPRFINKLSLSRQYMNYFFQN